ncbi:MAG: WD40/YVTN/BNR-like repeat-containing protein, partial [Tepidisphaerales bacterium]
MSDTLFVATRKGLFRIGRSRGQWTIDQVDFLGDNVTLTLTDRRDGRTYAALDHGHFGVKLHRSTATGWEEISAPTYPPKPEGLEDNDMWGNPLVWSTARIWALQPGGPDEPGVLWCGTMPGGLFRSTDHGASWTMLRSLWDHPKRRQWNGAGFDGPGIHSILVDPRDSQRITIAVSTGGIWFTPDAGASWAQRGEGMRADHVPPELTHDPIAQDVHCLAQCRGTPERMWVQHHNGIFVSSDEGRKFTEITGVQPSVFGFPVVAHPRDKDTAWFVPGI